MYWKFYCIYNLISNRISNNKASSAYTVTKVTDLSGSLPQISKIMYHCHCCFGIYLALYSVKGHCEVHVCVKTNKCSRWFSRFLSQSCSLRDGFSLIAASPTCSMWLQTPGSGILFQRRFPQPCRNFRRQIFRLFIPMPISAHSMAAIRYNQNGICH